MNKPPKGFLVKTNNKDIWDTDGITFSSLIRGSDKRAVQRWFTSHHTHNPGAVKNSIKFLIPKLFYKFPYEPNHMVNKSNIQQEENGVEYILINVTANNDNRTFELKVIQHHHVVTVWWIEYMAG